MPENLNQKPDNPSSDFKAMSGYWEMVDAILGGAPAMRSSKYLPKFEDEGNDEHTRRIACAPFTNVYADISGNLASKPFSRELKLKEGAPPDFVALAEDIDGQGNNLHNFSADVFRRGIDNAIDWILVDFTKVDATRPLTIAEERSIGARPYWVHIPASRMLAVYSDRVNGQEIFTHARIAEPSVERNGFDETPKTRVRVLNRAPLDAGGYAPATSDVYEQRKDDKGVISWIRIEGPSPFTIEIIPLVPFVTGKRLGASWQFRPPLRDIAYLQVHAFQQESGLQQALEYTAFPMLAAIGVNLQDPAKPPGNRVKISVGPKSVLNAPPDQSGNHGDWKFVEPGATSIAALEAHLENTHTNMRDLGMQPLTKTNLTVITTANVSLKAHSAVQAWTLRLKDALEQALKITGMWLRTAAEPEVDVFQDFGVDFEADTELTTLLAAQTQGVISKRTTQEEFMRRGVLSDNFDPDEEAERLAGEGADLNGEEDIDPVTGEPVQPPPRPLLGPRAPAEPPPVN